ncbi:MAG: DNA gyrase/topoisomerase IV subunit A, partial [Bradymonadia bacterium]
SPPLYERGVEIFGSWDAALASTLVYLRNFDAALGDADHGPAAEDVPLPDRVVGPNSRAPLFFVSRSGAILEWDLDKLPASRTPLLRDIPEAPSAQHSAVWVVPGGEDSSMLLITSAGQGMSVDSRLLAKWASDASPRQPRHQFSGLAEDEVIATGLPRRALRTAERFYSVSVFGQIKASDTSDYGRLSADAISALLLKSGDALFEVFTGSKATTVFVASSAGKAIIFSTDDVRSQGRKATGVRAIGLDPGARVVGAFDTEGVDWLVLATERGLLKRMAVSDFRPQKRGGNGLQSTRPSSDDPVSGVCGVPIDGDLIVLTSAGRVARFPAWSVPFAGRAARPEMQLALEDGETIEQVVGVPAGDFDT